MTHDFTSPRHSCFSRTYVEMPESYMSYMLRGSKTESHDTFDIRWLYVCKHCGLPLCAHLKNQNFKNGIAQFQVNVDATKTFVAIFRIRGGKLKSRGKFNHRLWIDKPFLKEEP